MVWSKIDKYYSNKTIGKNFLKYVTFFTWLFNTIWSNLTWTGPVKPRVWTERIKSYFSRLITPSLTVVWSLSGRRPLVCIWQPLVYDAKSLSGNFYYGKKIEQRVCLKFCVSNGITATESLKMLQKCFREFTLSRTQVFE